MDIASVYPPHDESSELLRNKNRYLYGMDRPMEERTEERERQKEREGKERNEEIDRKERKQKASKTEMCKTVWYEILRIFI